MANATSAAVRPFRALPRVRELAVGVGAALSVAFVAFANGGYFPTAWGWGSLAALTLIAGYLVVGEATRPSRLALASLAGLAAFGAWTWLGLMWSEETGRSLLEGQRVLLYVGALAALVLVVRRQTVPWVLAATLVAVSIASAYGLATRLFPERLGVYDPIAGYRLEEPLTYWNALGIFAAMGALLALGFAARGRALAGRMLASASLPVLLSTVYFTFSRGAWIAGAIGLAVAVAVDPRRVQLIVTAFVLAPAQALAVLLSSRQEALTRTDAPLSAATHDGHRLALYVLLLAGLSALAAGGLALAERRVHPPRTVRLAFGGAVVLVALAVLLTIFVRYGGPVTLVRKGYDSFTATGTENPVNLNQRLFTFSGSRRAELWEEAWDDYRASPVLGSGPGSYEQYWLRHRGIPHKVRDAHNLYLEVLAELGPIGLVLLALAFGAPLAAAVAGRAHPLVPAALAAFAAYLTHAAVDWDWEMSAVTLVGLTSAAALLAAADGRETPPRLPLGLRAAGVAAALVLSMIAFVGLIGASALGASERALGKGRYEEAGSQARKAARWWRWQPDPWRQLGDTQAAEGNLTEARESYRKAISKDRRDWLLWYDLASVSDGGEARSALDEAARLNPFFRSDLEEVDTAPQ